MPRALPLRIAQAKDLAALTTTRPKEKKLGEDLSTLSTIDGKDLHAALAELRQKSGARYALLGIPEDIGPRANCSRPGADKAWSAFLSNFLNIQSNHFIDPSKIVVLGSVAVKDLQDKAKKLDNTKEKNLSRLRNLCAELDERVVEVVHKIVAAELELIVIGGGHNNTYPIQKGFAAVQKEKGQKFGLACINCDPHADFRPREGRHSGNGFSYAFSDGILKDYAVVGLHESYNSETLLKAFKEAGFYHATYEQIKVRGEATWEEAITAGINRIQRSGYPIGIELDLDAIAFLPVSAETPNGISSEEAAYFIHRVASACPNVAYLHLPEGAPTLHVDPKTGSRYVGRTLVNQVLAYIKARESARLK